MSHILRSLISNDSYKFYKQYQKTTIYRHDVTKEFVFYGLGDIRRFNCEKEAIEIIDRLFERRLVLYNLHSKEHDLMVELYRVQSQIWMLD